MNSELELDKRISVLEKSMEWAQGSIQDIHKNLDNIQHTQVQIIDKISEFKMENDQKFHEVNEKMSVFQSQTDARFSILQSEIKTEFASLRTETIERISSLQAHTDERISSLQAHTDERISSLQAHTDEKLTQTADRISALQAHTDEKFLAIHARFVDVHEEFAGVHKEIAGIHHAISVQTKWLLGVMIACAAMISFLHPLAMSLLAK
ncbi:MAG: hypothetical protein OEZ34_13295 [Spirochaetia bacterium]|nr:hypothetical protein [Spirochaetia bacterium]